MQQDKHKDEALTPEEKAHFAALNRELQPADSLEEKTVERLKLKGLLQPATATPTFTLPRAALAFAASVLLFAIGFTVGQRQSPAAKPASPEESVFVLFLYDSPQQLAMDQSALVQEYGNWIHSIGSSGRFSGGEKLKDGGSLLHSENQQLQIADASQNDTFGPLSGYFLIEAESYDEALKIAKTCPHLKYDGRIELREVDRL